MNSYFMTLHLNKTTIRYDSTIIDDINDNINNLLDEIEFYLYQLYIEYCSRSFINRLLSFNKFLNRYRNDIFINIYEFRNNDKSNIENLSNKYNINILEDKFPEYLTTSECKIIYESLLWYRVYEYRLDQSTLKLELNTIQDKFLSEDNISRIPLSYNLNYNPKYNIGDILNYNGKNIKVLYVPDKPYSILYWNDYYVVEYNNGDLFDVYEKELDKYN